MARLLFLICLGLAVLALAAAAMVAVTRAARAGRAAAHDLAREAKGDGMEKVSYAALMLLMLGVTSGLLGGL